MQGRGQPGPALRGRFVPAAAKMASTSELSLRGRFAPVAISGRHLQGVQGIDKTHKPIASVAALTAQPLAALPPYGCGVPFTGSERLWQPQVLQQRFGGSRPPDLSLRGGRRPTWQSRSTMSDNKQTSANSRAVAGDSHVASLLGMTNLRVSRHRMRAANITSLHGGH